MIIYLCRHGQSTSDIEDRYGGDYDDHLTDLGLKQATDLTEKLKSLNIEIVFVSPKLRAQETAKILVDKLNCPMKTIDDFREHNRYGQLTGMIKSEAKARFPESVAQLINYYDFVIGAEAYDHFKKRIKQAYDQIFHSSYQTVAIVTHGGPIRFLFREILKYGEIDLTDCALIQLKYDQNKLQIVSLDGVKRK